MDKTQQAIQAFVAHKVAEGFDAEERVIEQALALFVNQEAFCPSYFDFVGGDETRHAEATVRPQIKEAVMRQFEERRRQEATWDVLTDCDRLDAAFAALEAEGIIALQNLPCCMTCARAEVGTFVQTAKKNGQKVVGNVFYHEQDTARVPYGHLFLAFGAEKSGDDALVGIGRRIVDILGKAGLKTEWKDDPDARIVVKLDWKKRRFTKGPPM